MCDHLQPQLRTLAREATQATDDAQRPHRLAMRADGGQRPERDGVGGIHRADQAESGLADVLHLPGAARSRIGGEAPARHLDATVLFVAHVAEHGQFHRAAEARAGFHARHRVALLFLEKAADLVEADDRIAGALGRRAFAAPGKRLEVGIDLRRELGHEVELVGALRRAVRQWLVLDLLLEHDHVLHEHGMERPRVQEEHAAFQWNRRTPFEALACGQVDIERGVGGRLEHEAQRLTPLADFPGDPFEMACGHVAGIHEMEQQHRHVFLLDRRRAAVGFHYDRMALHLP